MVRLLLWNNIAPWTLSVVYICYKNSELSLQFHTLLVKLGPFTRTLYIPLAKGGCGLPWWLSSKESAYQRRDLGQEDPREKEMASGVCKSLSYVWLFATLWSSPPGSFVHGILQARIQEWVCTPFFRGSSWPRDRIWVSYIAGRFLTIWATRKWQPTPVFLPEKSHRQRSLAGYNPWGHKRVRHNLATKQKQGREVAKLTNEMRRSWLHRAAVPNAF